MPTRPVEDYVIEKETLQELREWLQEYEEFNYSRTRPKQAQRKEPWWKYGYSISFDFSALLETATEFTRGLCPIFAIPVGIALGFGLIGALLNIIIFGHNNDS